MAVVISKKQITNPLAIDPSRTTTLRRSFQADMQRRFRQLKNEIWRLLVTEDAFGLKPREPFQFVTNRFQFQTDDEKLKSFNRWFANQVKRGILQTDHEGKPWTAKYVDSAYKKGRIRAYLDSHQEDYTKPEAWLAGSREQFLRRVFMQPEAMSKLRLLGTRNFEQLKGITADMSAKLNRVLASGMAAGWAPSKIARQIYDEIDGISKKRARVLAHTEIMHAHAEGQLDSFEELGVEELEITAEWGTAGDKRVCPRCNAMSGKRFTIAQARGIIPLHPLCRCSWRPVMGKKPSKLGKKQIWALGGPLTPVKAKPKAIPAPKQEEEQPASKAKREKAPTLKEIQAEVAKLKKKYKQDYKLRFTGAASTPQRTLLFTNQLGDQLEHMRTRSPALARYMDKTAPLRSVELTRDKAVRPGMVSAYKPRLGIKLATSSSLPLADVPPSLGGFTVARDVGSVFRHEYGRQLWQSYLNAKERANWGLLFEKMGRRARQVSSYAATNAQELWAEAFTVYMSPEYAHGMLPLELETKLEDLLLYR